MVQSTQSSSLWLAHIFNRLQEVFRRFLWTKLRPKTVDGNEGQVHDKEMRMQHLQEVRLEINNIRDQINTAGSQLPGQGTVDMQTLLQKEAKLTLKQSLI